MDPQKRAAIVTRLARMLRLRGSWCGETHLQKAIYLLQDLAQVPTDYDFILYKHGPFSFELRDDLSAMRADGLFDLVIQKEPYGPKLVPTEGSEENEKSFPKTLQEFGEKITWVAEVVGEKGVSELERVATALFITRHEEHDSSAEARAKLLHTAKPHVSVAEALEAVHSIDKLTEQGTFTG